MVGECQEGGSREGSIGARTAADCRGDMPDTSFRRKAVCTFSDRQREPNKTSQILRFQCSSLYQLLWLPVSPADQSVTRAPIGGGGDSAVSLPQGVGKWRAGHLNNR